MSRGKARNQWSVVGSLYDCPFHVKTVSYNFTVMLDERTADLLLLQGSAVEQRSHKLHTEEIILKRI